MWILGAIFGQPTRKRQYYYTPGVGHFGGHNPGFTCSLRGAGTRGCAIFSQKYISVHNSFMLAPIDLVMVSKESSFKELSNGMHFN